MCQYRFIDYSKCFGRLCCVGTGIYESSILSAQFYYEPSYVCAKLCPVLCDLMDCSSPWNFPGKNTGVDSCFLLWGNLLIQGLSLFLLYCQADSLPLSQPGKLNYEPEFALKIKFINNLKKVLLS